MLPELPAYGLQVLKSTKGQLLTYDTDPVPGTCLCGFGALPME